MKIILALIALQLILNIVLDKTGIAKKYFASSGGFIYVFMCGLWMLLSLCLSHQLFPGFFSGDFWFLVFELPWFLMILVGPFLLLIVQLIYSYIIQKIIFRK